VNDDTILHLRACPLTRGDNDDDDGLPLLGMDVLTSSRVRAGRLLLLVVSSDASEDAVINGDSRKLGR
jgi:hypothetical protein